MSGLSIDTAEDAGVKAQQENQQQQEAEAVKGQEEPVKADDLKTVQENLDEQGLKDHDGQEVSMEKALMAMAAATASCAVALEGMQRGLDSTKSTVRKMNITMIKQAKDITKLRKMFKKGKKKK